LDWLPLVVLNRRSRAPPYRATKLEHARLYFRYRPTRLPLAADPAITTLRDFRVRKPQVTPQLLNGYQSVRVDPYSELSEPLPITELATTLNHSDGYKYNETDMAEIPQRWGCDTATQLMGRFLLDRDGIVRWVDIECAKHGLVTTIGRFRLEAKREQRGLELPFDVVAPLAFQQLGGAEAEDGYVGVPYCQLRQESILGALAER
jgi:hypothetical protein